MTRLVAALLVALLALPARAVDCPPGDDACDLAVAVVRLDADLAVEQARAARLARELAACRATQGACQPLPPPEPAAVVWPWLATAGAAGVVVGVVLGVVLAR